MWTAENNMSIHTDKSSWMLASLGQRKEDFEVKYDDGVVSQETRVTEFILSIAVYVSLKEQLCFAQIYSST
jgi:hypothetical protein